MNIRNILTGFHLRAGSFQLFVVDSIPFIDCITNVLDYVAAHVHYILGDRRAAVNRQAALVQYRITGVVRRRIHRIERYICFCRYLNTVFARGQLDVFPRNKVGLGVVLVQRLGCRTICRCGQSGQSVINFVLIFFIQTHRIGTYIIFACFTARHAQACTSFHFRVIGINRVRIMSVSVFHFVNIRNILTGFHLRARSFQLAYVHDVRIRAASYYIMDLLVVHVHVSLRDYGAI